MKMKWEKEKEKMTFHSGIFKKEFFRVKK